MQDEKQSSEPAKDDASLESVNQPVVSGPPSGAGKKRLFIILAVVLAVVAGGLAVWLFMGSSKDDTKSSAKKTTSEAAQNMETEATYTGPVVDTAKSYGDKYANGLLPVGDSKYVSDAPKKGYIYMCNTNSLVPSSQAGAQARGPWFTNNNTQWDINKKIAVQGSVQWTKQLSVNIADGKRTITTNDLPDHKTGTFPVGSSDPARTYDANPNSIKTQSLTYGLTASPSVGSSANCIGGEVGIMLTGVALFDGFDAGGRDAGAWEIQDSCDGHPQSAGEYHYHTLSRCIKDVGVGTVIGFALDGFPITGPKVGDKNYLTTDDLDECHGIKSEVTLDGKKVTTYHYVMTQDFPYSVSCFRAKAIQPPGQHESTGGSQGGSGQGQPTQGQTGQQKPPTGQGTPPPPPQGAH